MSQKLLNDEKVVSRFWEKVRKTDTCWDWVGHKNTMTGYGLFAVTRDDIREAYLVSYEMEYGPLPEPEGRESMQIKQTCKNPRCVRPDHVQIYYGSERERIRASQREAAAAKDRTKCVRGHLYTEDTTMYDKKGHRRCRQCRREDARKRRSLSG